MTPTFLLKVFVLECKWDEVIICALTQFVADKVKKVRDGAVQAKERSLPVDRGRYFEYAIWPHDLVGHSAWMTHCILAFLCGSYSFLKLWQTDGEHSKLPVSVMGDNKSREGNLFLGELICVNVLGFRFPPGALPCGARTTAVPWKTGHSHGQDPARLGGVSKDHHGEFSCRLHPRSWLWLLCQVSSRNLLEYQTESNFRNLAAVYENVMLANHVI